MTATRNQIKALLQQEEAERLAAGAAAGHRVPDHQPVELRLPEQYGGTRWAIGCSCGQHAPKASARMSARCVWFAGHVKKLGLPRFDHMGDGNYGKAIYAVGPAKGLTWDEAYAKRIDING